MRIYLYLLAGICSASIGWNIGQVFLSDIFSNIPFIYRHSEIILFPCVAIALAAGMVLNEILISNPTRLYLVYRKAIRAVPTALLLGLGIGLGAGILYQLILLLKLPAFIARILGWIIIGLAVGLAEGKSWYKQSVEAGDKKRYHQRLNRSLWGGIGASLVAAILFEVIRLFLKDIPQELKDWEDFIGFCILGAILGLTFSFTSSPSYMAALRAGTGFEFIEEGDDDENLNGKIYPTIKNSTLKIVSESTEDNEEESQIEEGLSIQLPSQGKIIIGSPNNSGAHIRLPGVAENMGYVSLEGQKAYFKPTTQGWKNIKINGEPPTSPKQSIPLKHNSIITLIAEDPNQEKDNEKTDKLPKEKIYRFVYYNRFLDPQA